MRTSMCGSAHRPRRRRRPGIEPARADPYQWCAVLGGGDDLSTGCYYMTLQQCQASISGNGGFCTHNNFYDGQARDDAGRCGALQPETHLAEITHARVKQENAMRLVVGTLATLLVAFAIDGAQHGARADPYRWCAMYGAKGATNCYFVTCSNARPRCREWAASASPTISTTAVRC